MAGQLADAVVVDDGGKAADAELDIFRKMRGAEVQRVARTYLRPEIRMVLTWMPSGKAGVQ